MSYYLQIDFPKEEIELRNSSRGKLVRELNLHQTWAKNGVVCTHLYVFNEQLRIEFSLDPYIPLRDTQFERIMMENESADLLPRIRKFTCCEHIGLQPAL